MAKDDALPLPQPVVSPQPAVAPEKPSRTFSKRLVVASVALAWCALFYAIYAAQPTVAVAGFSFIAAIAGTYMGVGHMDLRSLLTAIRPSADYQPDPPPIEMKDP